MNAAMAMPGNTTDTRCKKTNTSRKPEGRLAADARIPGRGPRGDRHRRELQAACPAIIPSLERLSAHLTWISASHLTYCRDREKPRL